jgi:hypothetical protein
MPSEHLPGSLSVFREDGIPFKLLVPVDDRDILDFHEPLPCLKGRREAYRNRRFP